MSRVVILSIAVCVFFANSYSGSSNVSEALNSPAKDTNALIFSELPNKGTNYLNNLIITCKYPKLELYFNGTSIGPGSRTVKGIPYGEFTIDGRYEGKVLYNLKDELEYPESSKEVEIKIDNPYKNGVLYAVPSLIGASIFLGLYVSGSASRLGEQSVMLNVASVPLIIIGIKGIKNQINHDRWEKENRAVINRLEYKE
jgi:hypothetical protein